MRSEVVGCQSLQDQVLIINCFASQSSLFAQTAAASSCIPGWVDWRNVNRGHFTETKNTRVERSTAGLLSLQLLTTNNSPQQLILPGPPCPHQHFNHLHQHQWSITSHHITKPHTTHQLLQHHTSCLSNQISHKMDRLSRCNLLGNENIYLDLHSLSNYDFYQPLGRK